MVAADPGTNPGDSPCTNGRLVRLVGRLKIKDSTTLTVVAGLSFFLLPPVAAHHLYKARRARTSWGEVFFQLFSVGDGSKLGSASHNVRIGLEIALANNEIPPPELQTSLLQAPPSLRSQVRFVFISDTHMCHHKLPKLPHGDVLVHCGDFTNFGSLREVEMFTCWFAQQPHAVKLLVPGNHDMILDQDYYEDYWGDWSAHKESHEAAQAVIRSGGIRILVDELAEVCGVHVYGSPWVTRYASWRTAFNKEKNAMESVWDSLPDNVAVLLTHMPPYGAGDRDSEGSRTGCPALAKRVAELQPNLHVFGHVHSDFGVHKLPGLDTVFVNASCVSDYYRVGSRGGLVFDVPLP